MQPARLAAERDAPRDRPAPVVPDDREFTDAQRVGERENIGDQLVGGIGLGLLRLGRSAIAALIGRSEEHTSELQSLMRTSYAVFCLKKKKNNTDTVSL